MPTICPNKVSQHIEANCSDPIFAGLEQKAYLINREDIDAFVRANGIVSSLTLKTGTNAYQVQNASKQPFNGTTTAMNEGAASNTFNKTAAIIIPDNGPDVVTNVIEKLANGEFVLIFENKYKNSTGDNAFEVFGLDRGLHAATIDNDKYSEDTDGGWAVTLVEERTPHAATFIFAAAQGDPTVTTTRAYLDALLAS